MDDLYTDILMHHGQFPRHQGALTDALHATGDNPSCGDNLTLFVDVQDGIIRAASFQATACVITRASADMLIDLIIGKTPAEARAIADTFCAILTGKPGTLPDSLAPLAGVAAFPLRVKCATLAHHALLTALDNAA